MSDIESIISDNPGNPGKEEIPEYLRGLDKEKEYYLKIEYSDTFRRIFKKPLIYEEIVEETEPLQGRKNIKFIIEPAEENKNGT